MKNDFETLWEKVLSCNDPDVIKQAIQIISNIKVYTAYFSRKLGISEEDLLAICNDEKDLESAIATQKTTNPSAFRKKRHKWPKIAIGSVACLIILFTTLFGGVVMSSDFRHMVFSALEGDGKVIISSEMVDSQVSEKDLVDVMRPMALDGQGYTVRADGNFTKNYTLTYSKPDGSTITFDVRCGEVQIFLDTDRTGWERADYNGAKIYISNKRNGCTLEMLLQNELKCSIFSDRLTPDEILALAKSVGVASDTKK